MVNFSDLSRVRAEPLAPHAKAGKKRHRVAFSNQAQENQSLRHDAIAGKVFNTSKENPKLGPWDKKFYFLYKHTDGTFYKINKNSFLNRLQVDKKQFSELLKEHRSIDAHQISNLLGKTQKAANPLIQNSKNEKKRAEPEASSKKHANSPKNLKGEKAFERNASSTKEQSPPPSKNPINFNDMSSYFPSLNDQSQSGAGRKNNNIFDLLNDFDHDEQQPVDFKPPKNPLYEGEKELPSITEEKKTEALDFYKKNMEKTSEFKTNAEAEGGISSQAFVEFIDSCCKAEDFSALQDQDVRDQASMDHKTRIEAVASFCSEFLPDSEEHHTEQAARNILNSPIWNFQARKTFSSQEVIQANTWLQLSAYAKSDEDLEKIWNYMDGKKNFAQFLALSHRMDSRLLADLMKKQKTFFDEKIKNANESQLEAAFLKIGNYNKELFPRWLLKSRPTLATRQGNGF